MYKVISVNINSRVTEESGFFKETEFPLLEKYLSDGWELRSITPIPNPSDTVGRVTVMFTLLKNT